MLLLCGVFGFSMELRHLDPFLLLDEFVGRSSFLLRFSYYFIYFLLEYTKFHKVIPLVGSAVTVSVGFLEHPHRGLRISLIIVHIPFILIPGYICSLFFTQLLI
ncbi:hypothetical protein NE237_003178 [Protea cynaroides]|uniref:Uncharacterized protein n=1 Tax=Protea cynaroides TaxID=273540 RepID=A0A9Q0QSH4_9MAGN|nr:hypothetical protein NE237_003178 [Protea cynaroides]